MFSNHPFWRKLWLRTKARFVGLSPLEIHSLLGFDPHQNQRSFYTRGMWETTEGRPGGIPGGKTTALLVLAMSRATMKQPTTVVVFAPDTLKLCLENMLKDAGLKWCRPLIKIITNKQLVNCSVDSRELYNDL